MEYLGSFIFDEEKNDFEYQGENKELKKFRELICYMEDEGLENLLYKNYLFIKDIEKGEYNIYYVENEDEAVNFLSGEYPTVISEEEYKKIKRRYFKIDKKYIYAGVLVFSVLVFGFVVKSLFFKKEEKKVVVKKEIVLTDKDYRKALPRLNALMLSKIREKIEKLKIDGNTSAINNLMVKFKYGKKGAKAIGSVDVVYLYPEIDTKKVVLDVINGKKIYGFVRKSKIRINIPLAKIKRLESKKEYDLCLDKVYEKDLLGKVKIVKQKKKIIEFEKEIKNKNDIEDIKDILDNCSVYIKKISSKSGKEGELKIDMYIKRTR